MVDITRAGPSDEDGILTLAQRALGWGDDPRFRALYRWKHDDNPFGISPRWVALDGDRVVGFRVFLRWRFRRGDETVSAVRAVDTATDPEYQGQGIFRALTLSALDELRDEGVGFVFNTPNDQSRPGYLKMGWIELGRPPVAMAPRLRSLPTIARARTAAERWSEDCRAGHDAVEFLVCPGAAEELLEVAADGPARWRTDRSPEFLRWRYSFAPLRYRLITTGDLGGYGRPPGAVIFRVRRRGPALETTVSDVLAQSASVRRSLVRGALKATGADYALVSSRSAIDRIPSVSAPVFSPRLTWRDLTVTTAPALDDFGLTVGDLELF